MFFSLFSMNSFWLFLLEFLAAGAVVLFAGDRLAHFGDLIAEKSKFSHGWIGLILMAFITSLPELMTGISASSLAQTPDSVNLVISNTVGSNAANVVILAFAFLIAPKVVVKIKLEEVIGILGSLLIVTVVGFAILPLLLGAGIGRGVSIFISLTIAVVYFFIISLAYKTGGLKEEEHLPDAAEKEDSEKKIGFKFILFSLIIVVSATWMTQTADLIAVTPMVPGGRALGQTLVGAILLAVATSLPELSVTFSMAKRGNISMAVGNIFGSNLFNMFIIPIAAGFFPLSPCFDGSISFWQAVDPSNILLVLTVFVVTAFMGMDLIFKTDLKKYKFSLLNLLTILSWVGALVAIYFVQGSLGV